MTRRQDKGTPDGAAGEDRSAKKPPKLEVEELKDLTLDPDRAEAAKGGLMKEEKTCLSGPPTCT